MYHAKIFRYYTFKSLKIKHTICIYLKKQPKVCKKHYLKKNTLSRKGICNLAILMWIVSSLKHVYYVFGSQPDYPIS